MLTELSQKDKNLFLHVEKESIDLLTKISNLQNTLSAHLTSNQLSKELISNIGDRIGAVNIACLPLIVFVRDANTCRDEFEMKSFLDMELK